MTSPTYYDISPKPLPNIFNNLDSLTTKKEKYSSTPKSRKIPPRPPHKSISNVTRLSYKSFNNSQNGTQKAQVISFKGENDQPELSKIYDETIQSSYFKQCFIIEEKIGSGSFGDVFKVKSREDGKYYAVKVSRERFRGKLDREEKLNEVCKHEQLPDHDHLVKLYRAWEEKNRLYIQTELCATSLSALAETDHEISEDTVWRYLVDLLKAIDHLHSNDLIHLDIKPENIFISQDNKCKLGDFGLVRDVKSRDLSEATDGDPKYLASEVIQGVYTPAADIFSLGMTILELGSDLDIPSRGDPWHTLRKPERIPDKVFSKMSSDLKSIILLMLNPDYKLRPTARQLLNHPIVSKYEKSRRLQLKLNQLGKYLGVFDIHRVFVYLWSRLSVYINALVLPVRKRVCGLLPDSSKKESHTEDHNSSPINYNRAYVSTYLDQYSDDDSNELRHLSSSSSIDNSFNIDDDIFPHENFSSRNLCSTVTRNNNPNQTQVSSLSPFFPNEHSVDSSSLEALSTSIKSATQRLDFGSDEMEMTENDDDNDLSSIHSSSPDELEASNLSRYRFKHNITRKNLAKTFDEFDT